MDSNFGVYLETRRLVSGAVVTQAKGAVSWHSRTQAVTTWGTLRGGVRCLIRGGKGDFSFGTDAGFF